MKSLVLKIHETPHKAVLAITGGGAEAIGELLRYGGGSATLLEAVVPYDQKAFDSFVRGTPDKYCSPGAARDLAMAAFQRGVGFANTSENIVGIGASSSLVKDGERVGREHHAYIAVQTAYETTSYTLSLHGNDYSREQEERLVAEAILKALGAACKVEEYKPTERAVADPAMKEVILGERKVLSLEGRRCNSSVSFGHSENWIIFPGAFNPLHEQHANMAAKVSELTGQKVDLELCVRNVDKPALNYVEIEARLFNLRNQLAGVPWINDLHLTSTPTFAEKSKYFKNAKFLVGWDTFARINNPKYGDLNKVVQTFQENGTSFLVCHRIMNGKSSAEESLDQFHPDLLKISTIFSTDTLQPIEISSSEIRKRATT